MTWTVITSDTTMAINNGYGVNGQNLVNLTLPATADIGDKVWIQGMAGSGGWKIVQGDQQVVHAGTQTSTVGTGGSVASRDVTDGVELVCLGLNTVWYGRAPWGNFIVI